MKKILLALALVFLVSQTSNSLTVNKLDIFCKGSGVYSITVRNDSEYSEQYLLEKIPWFRDEFARNVWGKLGGELHQDCSDWITLKTTEFSLGGGERREIFFSVAIPKGLKTLHWTGISIRTVPIGKGLGFATRFRVKLFLLPRKIKPSGQITGMSYQDGILIFSFTNTGNIQLECHYSAEGIEGRFFILPS